MDKRRIYYVVGKGTNERVLNDKRTKELFMADKNAATKKAKNLNTVFHNFEFLFTPISVYNYEKKFTEDSNVKKAKE